MVDNLKKREYITKLMLFAIFGLVFGNFVTNAILILNTLNYNV